MNGCLHCADAVDGLGQYIGTGGLSTIASSGVGSGVAGGFWSGVGNFFSAGIGSELLKAGISFGVGYGLHELSSGRGGQNQSNLTGGNTVNPAGSPFIPQAQNPIVSPGLSMQSTAPAWVLPTAVVGGLVAVLLALRK